MRTNEKSLADTYDDRYDISDRQSYIPVNLEAGCQSYMHSGPESGSRSYMPENPNAGGQIYNENIQELYSQSCRLKNMQPAQKKLRSRKKQVKIMLSAAVFTLTLTAAASWQVFHFSAEAPALPVTKPQNKIMNGADSKTDAVKNNASDNTADTAADTGTDLSEAEKELALSEQRTDITTAKEKETTHISSVSGKWNLTLVNPWNPLPQDHDINLMALENGQSIDARCYTQLQNMMADCRNAGLQPLICSSYRTQEMQEALFQERMDELIQEGYSKKDARTKAATSVAVPGTSEHQLGLAVDIVDKNQQMLDSAQENTLVQQWLMENCWKYGFILRYPNNKSRLTGIIYEPWHYRYVGGRAAKEIHNRGICLEEYLEEQIS